MENFRKKVYNLIRDDIHPTMANMIFTIFIILLIIINVLIIIINTFDGVIGIFIDIYWPIEVFTVAVFTGEYILRLWTSVYLYPDVPRWKARVKFIFSFYGIIDLLAILPFYLPFVVNIDLRSLRMLRLLRMSRLLKIDRYSRAFSSIAAVIKKKSAQLGSSVFTILLLMLIASIVMYYIESPAQPEIFDNAFSGMWWAVTTITTTGYGDIIPITGLGKLLGGFISLLGIGLIAIPTGIFSAGFIEESGAQKEKRNEIENREQT